MITHHFINYKESKLHYIRQGTLYPVVLCFHGYGWNCYNFDYIMPELLKKFTVYSFDLFAHGESEWNQKQEFGLDDFKNIFETVFETHQIQHFSILAYSLGGRWATTLLDCFETRTEKLFLIAADGLQRWTIVDFLSRSKANNKIINYLVKHPNIVFGGLKLGHFTGLLDKSTLTFYLDNYDTLEKRSKIMKRISLCKNLFVSSTILIRKIHANNIKLHLFYGSKDYIMPPVITSRLTKEFGKQSLHIIDDDHLLIVKPKFLHVLKEVL